MRTAPRIAFFSLCLVGAFLFEAVSLYLVPEAYAVYGTRRRTARRTAIIVSSADAAQTEQAEQDAADANARADAAEQDAADADARADAAEQDAAASQAEADAAKAASVSQASGTPGALPIGTVVATLPDGCNKTVIGGVEYYYNGSNYYRAAFQGSQLVYVTTQP